MQVWDPGSVDRWAMGAGGARGRGDGLVPVRVSDT
jgi:hypothetical protein